MRLDKRSVSIRGTTLLSSELGVIHWLRPTSICAWQCKHKLWRRPQRVSRSPQSQSQSQSQEWVQIVPDSGTEPAVLWCGSTPDQNRGSGSRPRQLWTPEHRVYFSTALEPWFRFSQNTESLPLYCARAMVSHGATGEPSQAAVDSGTHPAWFWRWSVQGQNWFCLGES